MTSSNADEMMPTADDDRHHPSSPSATRRDARAPPLLGLRSLAADADADSGADEGPPDADAETGSSAGDTAYTFAVVAKNVDNPFFRVVRDGCVDRAARLTSAGGPRGVRCLFVGPPTERASDAAFQSEIMDELISGVWGEVDGIAIAAADADAAAEAIAEAEAAGIPTVTYDSDASPGSGRRAYIGTDNFAFGQELGKLLIQLAPEGGTYGLLAAAAPNVQLRVDGARDRLAGSAWTEVGGGISPADCLDDIEIALDRMYDLAGAQGGVVDAIIPVGGWPMYNKTGWREFVDENRNLKLVVGDSLDVQVQLMNRAYVDGLVGQVPYQMGEVAMDSLLKIKRGEPIDDVITGTSLLEILRFPLVLPKRTVDMNYIGNLAVLGYFLFAVITLLSVGFAAWTYKHQRRKERVVTASQPLFLYMICFGVLILGSSIVPMTIDDERHDQRATDIACMATPWLICLGFTTAFSALFSKLWRLNRIFASAKKLKKVKVMPRDVLRPYAALLTANVVVLTCWTALNPLRFRRDDHEGTDAWNRVISTYGHCDSLEGGSSGPYLWTLAGINFSVLILANVQAYKARSIHTEFSESHYIAVLMVGGLQALTVAVPLIFLVREETVALFLIQSILVFVVSASVLLLMFVPKMMFLRAKRAKEEQIQRKRQQQRGDKGDGGGRTDAGGGGSEDYANRQTSVALTSLRNTSSAVEEDNDDDDDDDDDDDGGYMMATRIDSQKLAWRSMRNLEVKRAERRRSGGGNGGGGYPRRDVNGIPRRRLPPKGLSMAQLPEVTEEDERGGGMGGGGRMELHRSVSEFGFSKSSLPCLPSDRFEDDGSLNDGT